MEQNVFFDIDFDYALSDNITLHLTATVELKHSVPHYLISNFHFKTNPNGSPLLDDMNLMAMQTSNGINWIHADSRKQTLLSEAVGKAIEEKTGVEFANNKK